jgi:hypothetical protein
MTEGPRLVTVGTINAGVTPIQADVTVLGSDVAVAVTLSTDYTLSNPRPPGFPTRPSMTGTDAAHLEHPGQVIAAGTTIKVLRCEATALVAAGAGTLA